MVFFYFSSSIPPYRYCMFLNNIHHQCWWTDYRYNREVHDKNEEDERKKEEGKDMARKREKKMI